MADIVLVTEASGYTGSHIVDHLLRAGYRVRGIAHPERVFTLRIAYLEYRDRFEAVGVADLNHDNLADVFRGVGTLIQSSLPHVKGQITEKAKSIVQSASTGTMHLLRHARAANVRKIIHTSVFANVLHPNDSWNPIVVTEDDWNSQTENDLNTLGLHPWCLHTAAQVIAERELWRFADANPNIDVTSILHGFPFGPYGRGQVIDQHRCGTFAWINELLHGPPGRPTIPNGPPYSPNYVHVADVARAHVSALRVGPLNPPRRKRVLLVAGYVLWPEVTAHLANAMPGIRGRLPSAAGHAGSRPRTYAQFEMRNAREILGIERYRGWREAFEDAVNAMLGLESRMPGL